MRSGVEDKADADPTPVSWLKFGQRNILYIGFVGLLVPLALALEGPRAPDAPREMHGVGFALALCVLVSAGFFLVNAGFVVANLTRGRRIARALIGCALPLVFGIGAAVVRRLVL